jgi:hypothetical protein
LRGNTDEKGSDSESQKKRYQETDDSLLSLTILPGCFKDTVENQMESTKWTGDNFSHTREPTVTITSLLPDRGLLP